MKFSLRYFTFIFFVIVFNESFANGESYVSLDSCNLCKKTISAVQIPIWKSKVHFTPVFAWNNSDETRTVLYVDFIRPMPIFLVQISK